MYYNIHNFVAVEIDPLIGSGLIEDVDFQIKYFKSTLKSVSTIGRRIAIEPYAKYLPNASSSLQLFQLSKGFSGVLWHDPEKRIVVKKDDRGFTIFTDSPNFLINLYIQFLLIESGYSMVHAAAVCDQQGQATLLPGAGGVGKTALVGYLVKEQGFKHLGDDIVILGKDGGCLSFPRAFVLKAYHRSVYPEVFERLNIKKGINYGLKRFVVENAPFVGIAKKMMRGSSLYHKVGRVVNSGAFEAAVPVEEMFGAQNVGQGGRVDRIIFLERYEGKDFRIEKIDEESLCRRMFSILHHEWVASMAQCFSLGALEVVDLPVYFRKVAETLRSCISGKKCQVLSIPAAASPRDLLRSYLELSKGL